MTDETRGASKLAMTPLDAVKFFNAHGILQIDRLTIAESPMRARLAENAESLKNATSGTVRSSLMQTSNFPAHLITTRLDWSDLVLAPEVLAEIRKLNVWILGSETIAKDWGLGRTPQPGFRSLFHGPPGTGKTLTAMLIGATAGIDVYRIDLSMFVSRYIGETEKNLATVFDAASKRHWILFFDEADSLFGKRTQTSSSNDRYANQEVSYLLQRIEDSPGVVILASNLQANIDEALERHFQSVVHFPMPDAGMRARLWRDIIGKQCRVDDDVDLDDFAKRYELSGGSIVNVVRYAANKAVQRGLVSIRGVDLKEGIRHESKKTGKPGDRKSAR